MKIYNTKDGLEQTPLVMLVYGQGGVGKTSFATTAPKPIIMDCENGAKFLGNRGIESDVAVIEDWDDVTDFFRMVRDSDYETIIVDPIGELMEKLKKAMRAKGDMKLVSRDGSPTMAGWGWLKEKMRHFVKATRDLNKHMIIVAHVSEIEDDNKIVKRPQISTKLSEELVNIVDVVGYMTTVDNGDGNLTRRIFIQPGEKYEAKDRTGLLGEFIDVSENTDGSKSTDFADMIENSRPKRDNQKAIEVAEAEKPEDKETAPASEEQSPKEQEQEQTKEAEHKELNEQLDEALKS